MATLKTHHSSLLRLPHPKGTLSIARAHHKSAVVGDGHSPDTFMACTQTVKGECIQMLLVISKIRCANFIIFLVYYKMTFLFSVAFKLRSIIIYI